jgi:asparagine synthase (glutamine-hydrolysing)
VSAIAGHVDATQGAIGEVDAMIATLRHRARGVARTWRFPGAALGAIGRSAMQSDADGDAPLVMLDGYIANEPELANMLGVADRGEALLALGYLRWGDTLVARLAGGFAIAIWDPGSRRLLLARDPVGVKPLYYFRYGAVLLFGSEPKAIFADPRCERRLDWDRIAILLQPRLGDAAETPLLGLAQVRPGHVIEFAGGVLRERCYWALASRPHMDDYETTVHRVRALIEESVAGATRDTEHGVAMLSGGLDSTAVAAIAGPKIADSFCVRFAEDVVDFSASALRPDIDAPFAAEAAAILGLRHHEVSLATEQLLGAIPATRRARDLPGWGQFDASMYCLFGEMATVGATGLSGEAADELFGGYPFFFDAAAVGRQTFPWQGSGLRLWDFLCDKARARAGGAGEEATRYRQLIAEVPRLDGEPPEAQRMRELFYLGMQGPLNIVVERKDRMSAAWGLDLRLPYCDHRLIDYVWNIPWSFKAKGGVKGLLKDAVRDVVPPSTLLRRKSAYPHIQSDRYHDALIAETLAIAAGPQDGARHLFTPQALRDLVARLTASGGGTAFPGGADPRYLLVHIVELHRWLIDFRISL